MSNVFNIYPQLILLESTNYCNYKCIMCPNGYDLIKNKGYMNFELYKRIIKDLCELDYKPMIGLHIGGEPLLHPQIAEMVKYATEREFYVLFHTNGALLNNKLAEDLAAAGISEISFSFEGEDKVKYEHIRRNGNWECVYNNIKNFMKVSSNTKVIIEVLKFRDTDTLEIDENFKKEFKGAIFKSYYASDWHGTFDDYYLKENDIKTSEKGICKGAFNVMAIGWDGRVKGCGIDYNTEACLGDLNRQTIIEVIEGEERRSFLDSIYNKKYEQIDLCANCSSPYTQATKERNFEE